MSVDPNLPEHAANAGPDYGLNPDRRLTASELWIIAAIVVLVAAFVIVAVVFA